MSRTMTSPLLVFDLDGTLIDTAPDLIDALDHALRRRGLPTYGEERARDAIGRGAKALIEQALDAEGIALDDVEVEALLADFLDHYEKNIDVRSRPYPGLEASLDALEADGWAFAVCTNKREGLSRLLLDKLGLTRRFRAICGADTFPVRKPDAGHLLGTIERAGADVTRAIMVGDSRTDLDAAANARVPFIGVPLGYTPVPMREMKPDHFIEDYRALTPAFARGVLARGLTWRHGETIDAVIATGA